MADADINQLQLLQQNLQNVMLQKQQFQKQIAEFDSALEELENTETAYKIIGNIMVASKKDNLKKDLEQKKEVLSLRIKNFEKQEKTLKENTEELQKKVLENLKKKNE